MSEPSTINEHKRDEVKEGRKWRREGRREERRRKRTEWKYFKRWVIKENINVQPKHVDAHTWECRKHTNIYVVKEVDLPRDTKEINEGRWRERENKKFEWQLWSIYNVYLYENGLVLDYV